MAVKVRLTKIGRKKLPFYRIVAIDSRVHRDGQALEILGTFDPRQNSVINLNIDGVTKWVKNGAQMSDRVKNILRKNKVLSAVSA